MNKKVFFYEWKQYIKLPLAVAAAYFLAAAGVWITILAAPRAEIARSAFLVLDNIAEGTLYALFVFLVALSAYRTAAYGNLYAKVNQDPFSVLAARMICLAICTAGATLLFLLGGTVADLLFQAKHTVFYSTFLKASALFTLCARNPFYFLFCLSTAMSALVLYSACAIVIAAVRSAERPGKKIFGGIFWAALLGGAIYAAGALLLPTNEFWAIGGYTFFSYPLPLNYWSLNFVWKGGIAPVCYVCWDIFNWFELAAGVLFILLAFTVDIFFRRKEQ